ncbi:hypothetical protein J8I87_38445 [Paraburkholderia sp. LEh10]|uniref:hypothetical protein n=1 Tax=Paraburkholderia sp. LEh10 TaxID=2821353 RepID=UPI001AE46439|nr:hypothetical protein [Paraburkholderia sp. LEh10]MBP0595427.1 hypothetical protein [Paraburkholderia sp. LEh10]
MRDEFVLDGNINEVARYPLSVHETIGNTSAAMEPVLNQEIFTSMCEDHVDLAALRHFLINHRPVIYRIPQHLSMRMRKTLAIIAVSPWAIPWLSRACAIERAIPFSCEFLKMSRDRRCGRIKRTVCRNQNNFLE